MSRLEDFLWDLERRFGGEISVEELAEVTKALDSSQDLEDPELQEFVFLLLSGEPAPLDLQTALLSRGYDIGAIEAQVAH